jgi:hypothetical protein
MVAHLYEGEEGAHTGGERAWIMRWRMGEFKIEVRLGKEGAGRGGYEVIYISLQCDCNGSNHVFTLENGLHSEYNNFSQFNYPKILML